ncbi:unnamed protein product [Caenorhabditis brenneri]
MFFPLIVLCFKGAISQSDKVQHTQKLIKCRRDLQIGYFGLAFFGFIPQIVVLVCRSNPVVVFAICITCNFTAAILHPFFIIEHIRYYEFDDSPEISIFKLKIFLFHLLLAGASSLLNWLIGSGEHAILVLVVSFFYAIFFSPCTMELCAINMFDVRVVDNEDGYRGDTNPYDYRAHIQARRRAQRENEETEMRGMDKQSQFNADEAERGARYITHGLARAAERRAQMNTATTTRVSMVLEESHVSLEDIENGLPSSSSEPHLEEMDNIKNQVKELDAGEEEDAQNIPSATCLECNVCMLRYSTYVTPRILVGCGHTICQGCVSNLLISESVLCPFCRKSSTVPGGLASGLPKNFAILGMIQELGGGARN